MDGWQQLQQAPAETVTVAGVTLRAGSRVLLRPRPNGDLIDRALAGTVAIVDAIEQDIEGAFRLAVTLEDDPARGLGPGRQIGHRFFFSPDEVEPLSGASSAQMPPRILVAGIGNVFLGDDGFGVEVVMRLGRMPLPPGVDVVEFGIRGMDLAYALGDGYDAAVLVDATPQGDAPGTVYVLEPELDDEPVVVATHGMDPVRVLALAGQLGNVPARTLVVGCEPLTVAGDDPDELLVELSAPVAAAVDEAVAVVASLVEELAGRGPDRPEGGGAT